MCFLGVTSNIMSLGGIALAIGELVDAAIVMVENAYRRISEPAEGRDGPVPYEEQPREVVAAAQQVGRAIFFSLAIIILSFVPVFMLEAQEGACSGRWPTPRRSRWPPPRCSRSRSCPRS